MFFQTKKKLKKKTYSMFSINYYNLHRHRKNWLKIGSDNFFFKLRLNNETRYTLQKKNKTKRRLSGSFETPRVV